MEKPRTIKISESKIREAVISGVKKHLNEISYNTLRSAYNKSSNVDFDKVYEALKTLQMAINSYDSDSFHTRKRAMNHFIATGKEPVDSAYEKFSRYIDEMRTFFERKDKQSGAFYSALPEKANETEAEILDYLHSAGYKGNNIDAIIDSMDYDQMEEFKASLPQELAIYFEENL